MTMSLAVLLKELGFSPTEIAWKTLQANMGDTLEKVERHQDYQQWTMAYQALRQEGRDPLEYFKQKFHGWAPKDLKHLLIQENPSVEEEVNAMPTISDDVAHQFWKDVEPDNIRHWGPEGDPRQEAPAEPEPDEEDYEEPDEIPFGPAGNVRVDEEYADEPAIPAAEVERDEPEVIEPVDVQGVEDHAAPIEDEGEDDEDDQIDPMVVNLLEHHPQQAAVSWFIRNFGRTYNKLAHEKNHISWDQSWSDRIEDIHALPPQIHDQLVAQTFEEMRQKMRQQVWGSRQAHRRHMVQDLEGNWEDVGTGEDYMTRGRPNPFSGRINRDAIEGAVRQALAMAKVSGRSLAEANVKSKIGGERGVGDLAQILHHDLVTQNHVTNLPREKEKVEGVEGAACPDCKMGHHELMYHHNTDSQWAAGTSRGRDPRQRMGTGIMLPDFNNYTNQQLKDALFAIEQPESGEMEPGRFRGKNWRWRAQKDLEHYYTNNLIPHNVRRQMDNPHGAPSGMSGIRVPQTRRVGQIRRATADEIQAVHGPSMYRGDIPVESSGFVFPGEFHDPGMFQFQGQAGAQDWSDLIAQHGGENPNGSNELISWLMGVQEANRANAVAPEAPQQPTSDFFGMTEQMAAASSPVREQGPPNPVQPETQIKPLPPMRQDAILPPGVPLSEAQVRAHEHLGQLNRITPLNWTGGPTKCVVCAGHGEVSANRAAQYARASPQTGPDVAGMTEQELQEWMRDNYRPAGIQGTFHDVTADNLASFQALQHIPYDPEDEDHVRYMQTQIQSPTGGSVACPHCDAPHPLMHPDHKAATGVCPTCTGDGRMTGQDELKPLLTHIDNLRGHDEQGEAVKRPYWLTQGEIGQERDAKAAYEKEMYDYGRAFLTERKEMWDNKVEPHFTRWLDHSLLAGGDLTEPAHSISRLSGVEFPSNQAEQHQIIADMRQRANERLSRLQGTLTQPTREEGRAMARQMRGESTLAEDLEAAGGEEAMAEDPKKEPIPFSIDQEKTPLPFGLDERSPEERDRDARIAEHDGAESLVGDGTLTAMGPMYLTTLEHILETGRGAGRAPVGGGHIGHTENPDIIGESVYGPKGSGHRYANVLNERMKERAEALNVDVDKWRDKVHAANDMVKRIEDYINNPNAPAEENPISLRDIVLPNGVSERVEHWDPHTRQSFPSGASRAHLSPFHLKMKEYEKAAKLLVERTWKKNHKDKYAGKEGLILDDGEGGAYRESDADRAWNQRTEKSERDLLPNNMSVEEARQHLLDDLHSRITTHHHDIHSLPATPVGQEPTQQNREFHLARLQQLANMARVTPKYAEYKLTQEEQKRDEFLLKNEPNRLWQAVLRAHQEELDKEEEGQADLTNQYVRDTMYDILEHHPGWVPYSLEELSKWRKENEPEPIERAFTSLRINRLMADILFQ